MQKSKKIISIFLLITTVIFCFSGCSYIDQMKQKNVEYSISSAGYLYIDNGGTVIPQEEFKDNTDIRVAYIPDSVTTIEKGAFEGCKNLTTVTMSNNITEIPKNCFKDCKALNKM